MSSILNPYLHFHDSARAAMEFYQGVFGGELAVNTFGDFGTDSGGDKDRVMHAQLTTPDGFTLMASDTPSYMEYSDPHGVTVSLSGDDEALRGWFAALSDGGRVTMPLEKQVWGDEFGMVTDKFGVEWMVNVSPAG